MLTPKTSGPAWGCDLDDVGVGDGEINGEQAELGANADGMVAVGELWQDRRK